jgi:hypothetical protein
MTTEEFGGAIAERVATCGDGLVREEAAQILGKLGHRFVALGGIGLQRLGQNSVEIASQDATQSIGRGCAPGGTRADFFAIDADADGGGEPRRLRTGNRLS